MEIKASEINKYSTIIRACVTASNAAASLREAEALDAINKVLDWALEKRNNSVTASFADSPALG